MENVKLVEKQMIATITLNPCLDRFLSVYGLVVDEVNRWATTRLYAGGKGIDVSRAIHEVGGRTIAYGFIGGAAGRTLEILLDEDAVSYSFTPIEQETRTNFIIVDTRTSQQTRIDAPGPRISRKEQERFYRKMERIYPRPSLVVAGGSIPPGIPANVYHAIVMAARKYEVRTILDSEGKWLEEGIKAKPYLIKPNVREAAEFLKTELPTEESIVKAALSFVDMGVEIAVISRGKDGIIAADNKQIIKAVPPVVKVRSTLGAGDCTIAGLATKLANQESLIEACRLATAMGAATAMTPGAELCHRADVETLLPQINIEDVTSNYRVKVFATGSRTKSTQT
ncbi:1-phosphofructokinase [Chloroflexota bacterium]